MEDFWRLAQHIEAALEYSAGGMSPRKSAGDPSHLVAAMNIFVKLAANDYVEIMYRVSDVGVTLEHFAASASPDRPAVPSVVLTVSFVSNLSTEA